MTSTPPGSRPASSPSPRSALRALSGLHDFGVVMAALSVGLVFACLAPAFLTPYNLFNLLRQTAELGIVAMAMTVLIVSGEFDLSVGAVYAVAGMVAALLFKEAGVNLWVAGACGLAAAGLLGLLNGLLVTVTRMNSFIATLAAMMVYRGIAMVLSRGQPVSGFPDQLFFELAGRSKILGAIPIPVLWLVLWAVLLYVLLHRTAYGVRVFATGDNREAAELAGIRTVRIKLMNFILTALAAGLAGLISLGYLKTVTPTQGAGLELEAIAASVIGGTSMRGGVGSIAGAFLGAFIMAEVRTGLVLMGTDAYLQDACVGLLIAGAVLLNVRLSRRPV